MKSRSIAACLVVGACGGTAAATGHSGRGDAIDAAPPAAFDAAVDTAPISDVASDLLDASPTRPLLVAPRQVVHGFMRDPSGRTVILRGVNLTGKNKYYPYLDDKTQADYERVRADWGLNSIRLVTTWAAIEPAEGSYDDAFLDRLALRVEWARQANVLVVVDMHQDVYGEGFSTGGGDGAPRWTCDASHYANFTPAFTWTANYLSADVRACYDHFWQSAELQDHYAEAWRRVAKRLASYDNVVGFDIMNEPFFGTHLPTTFERDRLMPLYEKVVGVVRSEAPGWIAFVEPSSTRNYTGINGLPKPTFANYMFAPHSYDPMSELGVAFDNSRRAKVIDNVNTLWQEAKALGGGLWIGEYGGTATLPGIADYMNANYDGMGAVAASSAYWDYSGSYGFIGDDGNEQTTITDAVVRPYPEAIAGTPVKWTFDPSTKAFSMTYHADQSTSGPTVISVPARVYPNGHQVLCAGCIAATVGAYVVVTAPPSGDPAVITVRP
jgi:endoglycosylceramidase